MQLSTRLDCDLVAVEQTDELTLLVELTAPTATADQQRQPATLQVVLDRSGSMAGDRLEGAKTALLALVDRLDPSDNLGVLAFDNTVQITVPAGPLTSKASVKHAIASIEAGGTTDLSGGYLRGLQEAQRVAGPGGATLLLISDGHANAGVRDPDQLGQVAGAARAKGITTSTLGFGLDYDEQILGALARGGSGNVLFAEEADTAVAVISGQVDGLLNQVAQAASLRITWTPHVAGVQVLNDLPVVGLPDGVMVELGSFYAGETRRVLVKLDVPGIAALGLAQVATLEFTHVSQPDLVQHTTTVPVHVNVVPGDQAAGRVPDPVVRSEALFQQTQTAKREASRLIREHRIDDAWSLLHDASASLRAGSAALPAALSGELFAEAALMDSIAAESRIDARRAAKLSSVDSGTKSRTRGRQTTGQRVALHGLDGAELVLEEWEVMVLVRDLPRSLAGALRPSVRTRDAATAQGVADALGADHAAHAFFAVAAAAGGFRVERR